MHHSVCSASPLLAYRELYYRWNTHKIYNPSAIQLEMFRQILKGLECPFGLNCLKIIETACFFKSKRLFESASLLICLGSLGYLYFTCLIKTLANNVRLVVIILKACTSIMRNAPFSVMRSGTKVAFVRLMGNNSYPLPCVFIIMGNNIILVVLTGSAVEHFHQF